MADQTEGTITIAASAAGVMEVITDYEAYPEWSQVESAEILTVGDDDRATRVAWEVKMPMLGTASYTLAYEYDGDEGVSWVTEEIEGPVKDISGEYVLEELDEDETRVTYRLTVELAVKVPGMLKRQGERTVIKTALEGLKARVEGGP